MSNTTAFSGIFIGSRSLLIQCAESFLRRGHQIRTVVSSDSTIQQWASDHDVPCVAPGPDLVSRLGTEPFDYLFSVANLAVLARDALLLPRRAAINFHDGPLPGYAGLNVTSWALLNQEREHGVSWHVMSERVDGGDILAEARFPITAEDTALTLNARCYDAAVTTFEELLIALESGAVRPRHQALDGRRYFGKAKLPAGGGTIDWSRSAAEIAALVRALDFGPYPNPLTTAKISVHGIPIVVRRIEIRDSEALREPGTVTKIGPEKITVSTGTNDVVLDNFTTLLGTPVGAKDLQLAYGLKEGDRLDCLDEGRRRALTDLHAQICKDEDFWLSRFTDLEPLEIPFARRRSRLPAEGRHAKRRVPTPAAALGRFEGAAGDVLLGAFIAYLSRIGGKAQLAVPLRLPTLESTVSKGNGLFSTHVPLRVSIDGCADVATYLRGFLEELALVRKHGAYALDVGQRRPDVARNMPQWHEAIPSFAVERVSSLAGFAASRCDAEWTVIIPDDARAMVWRYREDAFDASTLARIEGQFGAFLNDMLRGEQRLEELTILSGEDRRLLAECNATQTPYERDRCVHHLFEAQVQKTPDATAVVAADEKLSYAALNARANQLAHQLLRRGVGPGSLVGLLLDRCADMVVALIGILKAGAAYVPLDPTYPKDRLSYMMRDARLAAIVSSRKLASMVTENSAPVIAVDEPGALDHEPTFNPLTTVRPNDLAYVIYTSGSTGKPKGVMVEHGNVVNFFAGMDARLGREKPGTWLASTSISFDISVLEIFWTLARGFKVVLYDGDDKARQSASTATLEHADAAIGFSLFYFASDEGEKGRDKYGLLLDGARFADRNGFEAVWTPERHFHAFGGLYPNPSVASAAIAAITERIKIRAGSCVAPLHSPIRIAEEWALVDNLSNGRVGISFASGWQPDDFAIAPDAYEERQKVFGRQIETVRALWRGESRKFRGPKGEVEVKTLPRPVQPELPCWVTAAGNPETFRQAGKIGANMLTHLLGQNIEDLAGKLDVYRKAWTEAGHAGRGRVTLMLHAFVSDEEEFVRAQVHGPLKNYLRSATNLLKEHASSFPAFRNAIREGIDGLFQKLSAEDMEALLEHSFARYYETSGLFGTPTSCLALVDRLKAIGVDEIACLVDFGVPSDVVLANLPHLNELRERANGSFARDSDDRALPSLMARHSVTHLQVTPSMARMLVKNEAARAALRNLDDLLVGGEELPKDLAAELKALVPGRVLNMYGPTETTVWSAMHEVTDASERIPLGRPIANTQIYVMDERLQLLPAGVAGELVIGGDGVVRGYLNQPELTAQRFVPDPFRPGRRLYRTGDQAVWREDGVLEFLGRLDHQVKIRGHRIELAEIEAVLARHPAVRQAVVVVREDGGEKRLVGYFVPAPGPAPATNALRDHLGRELPAFMVPSAFVSLDAFPLTPNKKIDRKRLPAPDVSRPSLAKEFVAPRTPNEEILAGFFAEALALERVGIFDDFIELGGDSLSAVEVFVKIEQTFSVEFPLALLFQVPTVAGLASQLERALARPPAVAAPAPISARRAQAAPANAVDGGSLSA
jgi:natural product biosynthesis luciferase-like monooxygenase protein